MNKTTLIHGSRVHSLVAATTAELPRKVIIKASGHDCLTVAADHKASIRVLNSKEVNPSQILRAFVLVVEFSFV